MRALDEMILLLRADTVVTAASPLPLFSKRLWLGILLASPSLALQHKCQVVPYLPFDIKKM
jgi:hypothetical protein